MKKPGTSLVLVVAATSLAACGASSHTSLSDHAKASVKALVLKDNSTANRDLPFNVNATQAGCFADKIVDAVGVPELQREGALDKKGNAVSTNNSTDHMPKAIAVKFVDSMYACVDQPTFVGGAKGLVSGGMTGAPAASIACVENKVTVPAARQVYLASLVGNDSQLEAMFEKWFQSCQ